MKEAENIIAILGEEDAARYEELVKKEKELSADFRHAKMHYRMMDVRHSRMKWHDVIRIFLWISSWVFWKLAFLDIGKIPGMGHRWGRLGGTLYVVSIMIPLTIYGVTGLKEFLENSRIPYFMRRAKEKSYPSLAVEKVESEDIMFHASNELGPVQFELDKLKEKIVKAKE